MTRIQLDVGDLARLTVGPDLGPLGELLLSLDVLRERRRNPLTADWERAVHTDLAGWVSPLLSTAPADLLAAVRSSGDLASLQRATGNGAGTRAGGGDGRREGHPLVALLQRYHDVALHPYWPSILTHLEAERARRGRITAQHGVGHMLATLHPRVRWQPPFLDVDVRDAAGHGGIGLDAPVVLGGASVALVPSVFCTDRPRVLPGAAGGRSPCVVIYPALHSPEDARALWAGDPRPDHRALASLLGHTRARALEAITDTCSTTELAQRVGVSPPTASHHADVLRRARLVVSRRVGNATSHRLTALGAALLDAVADHRKNRGFEKPSG